MSRWRDSTRRRCCRIGFVLFCALPTLGVLAWAKQSGGPGQRAAHVEQLTQLSGWTTTLSALEYPAPGVTRYRDLEFCSPLSGVPLLNIAKADYYTVDGRAGLRIDSAEITAASVGQFWQSLEQRLRRPASADELPLNAEIGRLTVRSPLGELELRNVRFQLLREKESRLAQMSFSLADMPERDAKVRMVCRSDATAGELTTLELQVGQYGPTAKKESADRPGATALPCSLVLTPLLGNNPLGADALFRGQLIATHAAGAWSGELVGEFTNIDLETAVAGRFPHYLSGTAMLEIAHAQFTAGRLQSITGRVTAGPGSVGATLLTAFADNLGFRIPTTQEPVEHYQQLAADFRLDEAGIEFRGCCPTAPGAAMVGQRGVLLQPTGPSGPMQALICALVPNSDVRVPATREADWLIQRLPVPPVIPPSATKRVVGRDGAPLR